MELDWISLRSESMAIDGNGTRGNFFLVRGFFFIVDVSTVDFSFYRQINKKWLNKKTGRVIDRSAYRFLWPWKPSFLSHFLRDFTEFYRFFSGKRSAAAIMARPRFFEADIFFRYLDVFFFIFWLQNDFISAPFLFSCFMISGRVRPFDSLSTGAVVVSH